MLLGRREEARLAGREGNSWAMDRWGGLASASEGIEGRDGNQRAGAPRAQGAEWCWACWPVGQWSALFCWLAGFLCPCVARTPTGLDGHGFTMNASWSWVFLARAALI
jgi:hypothetical protein